METMSRVSPKLTEAFQKNGLTAKDFGTSEMDITMADKGTVWKTATGQQLLKRDEDSFWILGPDEDPQTFMDQG